MAIQLHRRKPPRPRAFQALAAPIDNLLTPLAYGPVGDACYAICPAPPGASVLGRSRPWPEAELLECVLRPAAHDARAPAGARHDPSRHPARQRLPERAGSAGRVRPVLGRAAGNGAAGTVRAAVFSDVPACRPRRRQHRRRCLCAWSVAAVPGARPRAAGAARRYGDPAPQAGTWDLRRAGGRSAAAADHRRSGARHAGRGPGASADRRPCCSTRRARVDVGSRHGRRGERSGPSSSPAARSGMRGRWPAPWRASPTTG